MCNESSQKRGEKEPENIFKEIVAENNPRHKLIYTSRKLNKLQGG